MAAKPTLKKQAAPRKQIRIADIAKAAQVSPGVVSSFFNGRIYGEDATSVIGVGEGTRQRILATCRQLGYRPDNSALRARIYPEESDVVFLLNEAVTEGIENSFFSLILGGIEKSATAASVKMGFTSFLKDADYLADPDLLPPVVKEGGTNKIIIGGEVNYSLLLALKQRGCAIAYVNRKVDLEGVVSVVPHYFRAARLAIETLHKFGHRKIAVVAEAYFTPSSYNCQELLRGCEQGFADCGLPFSMQDVFIKPSAGPEPEGSSICQFLASDPPPTAVFCFDDWTAHCVYQAAREAGLRIPADISVLGCNDDRSAAYMTPPLSTIHLPTRRIGSHAFEEVARIAAGGIAPVDPIILPVDLRLRESVSQLAPNA